MTIPRSDRIDLKVSRGAGLHLRINGRPVDDTYGTIVMAELSQLRHEFPAVRVDVMYHAEWNPTPARMAQLINAELDRNEIWD